MKFKTFCAAAVMGLAASFAQAKSYTFDFDNLGQNHNSLRVLSNEDSGFGVNVEGFYYGLDSGSLAIGDAIDVDTNAFGLISKNGAGDRHTIDSWGKDELMRFTFDGGKMVTLTSIVVSWFEGKGWYDVFTGNTFVGNTKGGSVLPAGAANSFGIGTRTLTKKVTTICSNGVFFFLCETTRNQQSGIKIKSITVDYEEPPAASVVPLPAAGLLMLGAIGGLGALRRRKIA